MTYLDVLEDLRKKGKCSCTNCVIIRMRQLKEPMKKEQKFWKLLSDKFDLDFMRRVEHAIESGWPDVHYSHNGHSGWIELKASQKFPSSIDFEPAQPIWLDKYWNSGGNCFVMLHVIEKQKIYVWAGKFAFDLDKPNGCHDVEPMLVVKTHEKGFSELMEMFSCSESVVRFPQRTS